MRLTERKVMLCIWPFNCCIWTDVVSALRLVYKQFTVPLKR